MYNMAATHMCTCTVTVIIIKNVIQFRDLHIFLSYINFVLVVSSHTEYNYPYLILECIIIIYLMDVYKIIVV